MVEKKISIQHHVCLHYQAYVLNSYTFMHVVKIEELIKRK